MTDWLFRVTSGQAADFAADLNAMVVANGSSAVLPANWGPTQTVAIDDVTRIDLDCFEIVIPPSDDRGLHVNARLSFLPNGDPVKVAQMTALWPAAISSWFGLGGGLAVCPTLTSYTNGNPTAYPTSGGQVWPSTGKTALITTAVAVRKRMYA